MTGFWTLTLWMCGGSVVLGLAFAAFVHARSVARAARDVLVVAQAGRADPIVARRAVRAEAVRVHTRTEAHATPASVVDAGARRLFSFAAPTAPAQLWRVLKDEHPQIATAFFASMGAQAPSLLSRSVPVADQGPMLCRFASLGKPFPGAVEAVRAAVAHKMATEGDDPQDVELADGKAFAKAFLEDRSVHDRVALLTAAEKTFASGASRHRGLFQVA